VTSRVRFALFVPVALAAALAAPPTARAGNDGLVPKHESPKGFRPEARIEEKIGATLPMDLTLRDENDKPISLGDAIGGKPTILVPVYYRCPMLCTKVLTGVLEACRQMPMSFSAGEQFNVVAVSMDPLEHGDLARRKKDVYLHGDPGTGQPGYGRPGAEKGWRFLTGTKESVGALLDAVGYKFEFDKMLKEYNHPTGIVIVSPQGKVSRYFYGIGYDGEFELAGEPVEKDGKLTRPTTTLRLSLIEAGEGKSGSLLDKLTLLCYRYDALHQGYQLNILWAVRIGGVVTLAALVASMVYFFRHDRRKGAAAAAAPTDAQPPHAHGAGGNA
jgi:protein SCO1/2